MYSYGSLYDFIDAEIGVHNDENKKLVTEDYLGLTDGEDLDVIDFNILPFLDTSIKIKEASEKMYFVPDGSQGISYTLCYRDYN